MEPVTLPGPVEARRDDQRRLRRARNGDADAFDAIAASRIPEAYRIAAAILGSEADAADATQHALVAAWRELPRLRDLEQFDAWFHRILVNECRMQVRRQARLRDVGLGDPAASSRMMDAGMAPGRSAPLDLLEGAFEELDPDDRAMVVLHHLERRSVTEVAAILHMPAANAKWRLLEARGVLEHALEGAE